MSLVTSATLDTLKEWENIAHENQAALFRYFNRGGFLLDSVSFGSQWVRFVYVIENGCHVADSIPTSDWLRFASKYQVNELTSIPN